MLNFAKLTGNGAVMTAAVAASGVAPAAVSAASAPSAASTGPAVPAAPAAYVPLRPKKNFGQLGDIVGFDPVPSALID